MVPFHSKGKILVWYKLGPKKSFQIPPMHCLINWQLGFITLLIGVIHIVIQCYTPFCKWLKGPTNSNFWTESGGIWFWLSLARCWLFSVPQIFNFQLGQVSSEIPMKTPSIIYEKPMDDCSWSGLSVWEISSDHTRKDLIMAIAGSTWLCIPETEKRNIFMFMHTLNTFIYIYTLWFIFAYTTYFM